VVVGTKQTVARGLHVNQKLTVIEQRLIIWSFRHLVGSIYLVISIPGQIQLPNDSMTQ